MGLLNLQKLKDFKAVDLCGVFSKTWSDAVLSEVF